MGYKCKEGAGPAPPASNALNTNTFQMPQMPPSSIKDHILEAGGRLNKICTGKKKSHSFRISKMGFLCRLLDDGNKMEVIDVMGDAISEQKMILTEKKYIIESILFQRPSDIFKGRLSAVEGVQKLPNPQSLVLIPVYFTVPPHGVTSVPGLRSR